MTIAPIPMFQEVVHTPGAVDFSTLQGGAMFGRPVITAAEIASIESGGAEDIAA